MSTWRDRLITARWRGVEFKTDSTSTTEGQRLVVNEYPNSDAFTVDDLGKKAPEYKINAYFIGAKYDLDRKAFLDVLRITGADYLAHPVYGDVWVRAQTWEVSDNSNEGGYGTVSITFVVGGEEPPTNSVDNVDIATAEITELNDMAVEAFEIKEMSANGLTNFIARVQGYIDYIRRAVSYARMPLTIANRLLSLVEDFKSEINELLNMPAAYADMLKSIAATLGIYDISDDSIATRPKVANVDDDKQMRMIETLSRVFEQSINSYNPTEFILEQPLKRNIQSNAVLNATLSYCTLAKVAITQYQTEATRNNVLNTLNNAVEMLIIALSESDSLNPKRSTQNSLMLQKVLNVQAAVVLALNALSIKPSNTLSIANPVPACVIANALNTSEAVFNRTNGVVHPLFVSGVVNG